MKNQVAVIGLGRFGVSATRTLYNLGHDVLAIDRDEDRVQGMMGQTTYAVSAECTNESALRELGVQDYDVVIVAIGSDIVSSVMTSVLLKTMGVPYVVARGQNELHRDTLKRVGVDRVIEAETEMGSRLAHSLFNPNIEEYLEVTHNFGVSRLRIPDKFVGTSLRELGFSSPRDKYGLSALALCRGRDVTLNPDSDERLSAGDLLIIAGQDEHLEKLDSVGGVESGGEVNGVS